MTLPRFRDLPLFAKILVPFTALILVIGATGAYFIVRDLSSRTQDQLNRELLSHSLDARSRIHDRELYLLESVNFASNLQGMAEAVKRKDSQGAAKLLHSVVALKSDLNLVAVTLGDGRGLVELTRASDAGIQQGSGTAWGDMAVVGTALPGKGEQKSPGFLTLGSTHLLVIASPVCSGQGECAAVGAALVGIDVQTLVSEAAGKGSGGTVPDVTIFDGQGDVVASSGIPVEKVPASASGELTRVNERNSGLARSVLYSPLALQGSRLGTVALSLPAGPASQLARRAGFRLAALLLFAMAGVVAVGALLSRYVLRQLRPVLDTSHALGSGDLAARAPVLARDEHGELATVLNQMADQLQASYSTLESRVHERTEEVRRLLQERTEFFAAISHELRTPIAVILAQVKMMRTASSRNKARWSDESAATITHSAEQLLGRVNDIIDLAKADSGTIQVLLGDVSLPKVLREMKQTIEGLASANGLAISVDVPARLPRVRADSSRLKQVILNLVDNSVKYTPSGGRVTVEGAAHNGRVEISVADTGVGIPPECGERVFEPFYRVPGVSPSRGEVSSGLGLAMAKRLVEAQGGTIAYSSEPGDGTTFTVKLQPAK